MICINFYCNFILFQRGSNNYADIQFLGWISFGMLTFNASLFGVLDKDKWFRSRQATNVFCDNRIVSKRNDRTVNLFLNNFLVSGSGVVGVLLARIIANTLGCRNHFWAFLKKSFFSNPPVFTVRCSSMVRTFAAHGVMVCRIDPSWWTNWGISHSSQCSTTGVTGCGMCYPFCGIMHIKDPLLLIGKNSPCN